MAESWSSPFLDAFGADKNIHVYEVSIHNYPGFVFNIKYQKLFANQNI
jgi:hypothetical protein